MKQFSTTSFFKINPDELGFKYVLLRGVIPSLLLHIAIFYIFQYKDYTQSVIEYQEKIRPLYNESQLAKNVLDFSTMRISEIVLIKAGHVAITIAILIIFPIFFLDILKDDKENN